MNNERIEMVRQYLILGVLFDERANWKAHICDAKARTLKKLNKKTLLKIHQMTILRNGVRTSIKGDTQTIRSGTP
jgi:hypothetical protein